MNEIICLPKSDLYIDDSDNDDCPLPPPSPQSFSWQQANISTPDTSSLPSPSSLLSSPPSPPQQPNPSPIHDKEETIQSIQTSLHQEGIAIRFHYYVFLMKCLCSWNEYTKLRKDTILSKRQYLKRIIFKWGAHVDEVRSKRNGIAIIIRIVDDAQQRAWRWGMQKIRDYSLYCENLERIFWKWHEFVKQALKDRMTRKYQVINVLSLSKIRLHFNRWKNHTTVQIVSQRRWHSFLCRVLKQWHVAAEESKRDWIAKVGQVATRVDTNNLHLLRQVFQYLVGNVIESIISSSSFQSHYNSNHWIVLFIKRSYSRKKKSYREALYHFGHQRAKRMIQDALKGWKHYHQHINEIQSKIKKIIKRQTLKKWKTLHYKDVRHQHITIQIIFNRWKYMADVKVYKRERMYLALQHRVSYLCKQVLKYWIAATTNRKVRLMTPSCSIYKMSNYLTADGMFKHRHSSYNPLYKGIQNKTVGSRRYYQTPTLFPHHLCHRHPATDHLGNLRSRRLDFAQKFSDNFQKKKEGHILFKKPFTTHPYHQNRHSSFNPPIPSHQPFSSYDLRGLERISQTKTFPTQRPIEHLLTTREGKSPSIPSWILNDLSNRSPKDISDMTMESRLQTFSSQNQEGIPVNLTAEPKCRNVSNAFHDQKILQSKVLYKNEAKSKDIK